MGKILIKAECIFQLCILSGFFCAKCFEKKNETLFRKSVYYAMCRKYVSLFGSIALKYIKCYYFIRQNEFRKKF